MIYSAFTGLPHLAFSEPPTGTADRQRPCTSRHEQQATGDFDNWVSLLRAVSSRLRSTAMSTISFGPLTFPAIARELPEVILECADDLDLLHAALNAESLQRCEARCAAAAARTSSIALRGPSQ